VSKAPRQDEISLQCHQERLTEKIGETDLLSPSHSHLSRVPKSQATKTHKIHFTGQTSQLLHTLNLSDCQVSSGEMCEDSPIFAYLSILRKKIEIQSAVKVFGHIHIETLNTRIHSHLPHGTSLLFS